MSKPLFITTCHFLPLPADDDDEESAEVMKEVMKGR